MRRFVIVVSSVVAFFGAIANPIFASAETSTSRLAEAESIASSVADGSLSTSSMTPRQAELFREFTTPAELKITKLRGKVNSLETFMRFKSEEYCRDNGVNFERKSLLGNVIYSYWQHVRICGNPGIRIHDVKVLDSGGETKTPTWSYQGPASEPISYRSGDGWHVRTSENFEHHVVVHGIGLGQRTECISADIAPSGEYHARENCE